MIVSRRYALWGNLFRITCCLLVWCSNAVALFETDMPYAERVTDGRFPFVGTFMVSKCRQSWHRRCNLSPAHFDMRSSGAIRRGNH